MIGYGWFDGSEEVKHRPAQDRAGRSRSRMWKDSGVQMDSTNQDEQGEDIRGRARTRRVVQK